ncbi:hypothetical protein GF358_03625 [Candidatus Woesearchaeota archaeon]|nr:hypothetical protein [Candidatus Woesearchaeota archaeon]
MVGDEMIAKETCPDCGSHDFFHARDRGEIICKKCSFVLDESVVDFTDEHRSFEFEDIEKNSRTGAPFDPRIADNLGTAIGNRKDLSRLNTKTKKLIRRIKKKNAWTSSSLQQNLNTALSNLKVIAGQLNAPARVEKEAAGIYRQAAEQGLTLKRSIENLVVGSIYIACKMHGIARSLKEFAEASGIEVKILAKTYKMMLRELHIKITPTDPIDFVGRFASDLKLSAKVQTKAIKYIENIKKQGLMSGLSPVSVAASTLYIAGLTLGEKRTQKKIAEISGITETTLRNRCKSMMKQLKVKVKIR